MAFVLFAEGSPIVSDALRIGRISYVAERPGVAVGDEAAVPRPGEQNPG
jgi:hypothetical protein